MTRSDLLSLADFIAKTGIPEADLWAADLRKLAELRPVAWCYSEERFGRSLLRLTHEQPDGCPHESLYQLSEVLTDE